MSMHEGGDDDDVVAGEVGEGHGCTPSLRMRTASMSA
jgi:hypothetical protein